MQDFTMKPLGVGGIIDRAFRIYRNNIAIMVLLSLVIGGTAQLIIALLELGSDALRTDSPIGVLISGGSFLSALDATAEGETTTLSTVLTYAFALFVTPFVGGGITFITMAVCHGERDTGSNYLSRVKGMYWKLVGTAFAVGAITILLVITVYLIAFAFAALIPSYTLTFIVCLVAALIGMTITSLAYPVAIHESRYGFSWFSRACELVFSRFWKSVAVFITTSIIVGLLSFILALVPYLFPPLINAIADVLITALLQPVMYIAMALLYLDIRIAREAYDLELRANSMNQVENRQNDGNSFHG